jgi:nucleoside-diphosphate-sugar epimerase
MATRSTTNTLKNLKEPLPKNFQLLQGDIRSLKIPRRSFDFYIHAATPSSTSTGAGNDTLVYETSVKGLSNILTHASLFKNFPTIMNISSGSVVSRSTEIGNFVPELLPPEIGSVELDSYASGKRHAEVLLQQHLELHGGEGVSPRLFTFSGPHLPLDEHYAFGNFMKYALNSESIEIKGNPDTVRSYLYPIDLIDILLKLLDSPSTTPINVGSDVGVTIDGLAQIFTKIFHLPPIKYSGSQVNASSYVPKLDYLRNNYRHLDFIPLENQILKHYSWLSNF